MSSRNTLRTISGNAETMAAALDDPRSKWSQAATLDTAPPIAHGPARCHDRCADHAAKATKIIPANTLKPGDIYTTDPYAMRRWAMVKQVTTTGNYTDILHTDFTGTSMHALNEVRVPAAEEQQTQPSDYGLRDRCGTSLLTHTERDDGVCAPCEGQRR